VLRARLGDVRVAGVAADETGSRGARRCREQTEEKNKKSSLHARARCNGRAAATARNPWGESSIEAQIASCPANEVDARDSIRHVSLVDEAIALATAEENPHEAAFGFAYIGKKRKGSFSTAVDKAREVGDSAGDYLLVAIASLRADAGDHDGAIETVDLVREPEHVIGVLARLLPRTPAAKTAPLEGRIAKVKSQADRGMLFARLAEVRARAGIRVPKDPFGGVKKPAAKGYLWLAMAHAHAGDPEAATAAAKACRGDPRLRAIEVAAVAWAKHGDAKKALALVKPVKDVGATDLLVAIARALPRGDEQLAILGDARARCAKAHPAVRARVFADAAIVEGSMKKLAEAVALATKLPPYNDPWRIFIDAAEHDAARAKDLARRAGALAAKDDWTAETWADHGTPYAWDPIWKVAAIQRRIDREGALETARLRQGARRAAAIIEAGA
jgi:hypothetical protein